MDVSTIRTETIEIHLSKIPILFSRNSIYALGDFSYGEYIILENNRPKFYFNVFDSMYIDIADRLKTIDDMGEFLNNQFKKKGVSYTVNTPRGIGLRFMEKIKKFELQKLPLEYLS